MRRGAQVNDDQYSWTTLHTEADWRTSCHVSIRQSPSCVTPFWTHAKCLLAFISYLPTWVKANYTFIKTVYSTRSCGGLYMQARHAFFNTSNMCDRGRTIIHMQIPRFHTQVWWNIIDPWVIFHMLEFCCDLAQINYHTRSYGWSNYSSMP